MTEILKIAEEGSTDETNNPSQEVKRGTLGKIFHIISDHPDLIAVSVITTVALAAGIQYTGKKLFDINIMEIVQESPSTLYAKIKCDQKEIYIKKDGNRIICYKPNGKAKNEQLVTPGITIPDIHIPEWKIGKRVIFGGKKFEGGSFGGGYVLKNYEPWWNHQVVVMDGFSTIYEGNYGDYVKQTPGCSITVTWNGMTQVLKDFDFKNFTKWTQQMDACRSQVEGAKK